MSLQTDRLVAACDNINCISAKAFDNLYLPLTATSISLLFPPVAHNNLGKSCNFMGQ